MSTIHVRRTHTLDLEKARTVASELAADLKDEHGLESAWEGNTLVFSGTGLSGHLQVEPDELEIDVKLGFLMRPFRRVLEREINNHLDEHLADAG